MKSSHEIELLPVLRRPRGKWQIPIFQSPEAKAAELEKERELKEFTQGTTPYGREVYRRTLYMAYKLGEQDKTLGEATKKVAEELETFSDLRSEFVLLIARTIKANPTELNQCTSGGLAMRMVLLANKERMLERLREKIKSEEIYGNER